MIWNTIKNKWNNKGFEICLGFCITALIIFALWNTFNGNKGTYSKPGQYFVRPKNGRDSSPRKLRRGPPRESKGEIECRRILESIFKKPFPTQRPDFLRNPVTGGNFNLELDCYNAELGLAVEYNGAQHYKYNSYFHRSKDHFLNQKYRDDMKRRMCNDNHIVLIVVPHTVKLPDIRKFLVQQLQKNSYLN